MDIVDRIREVIEVCSKNSRQFSLELGVNQSYISRILSRSQNINDRLIHSISLVFNVREDWLRTGSGEMFNSPKPLEIDPTQVVVNYIKSVLSELSEPNRQIVLEAVRQLKEGKNFPKPNFQSGPD